MGKLAACFFGLMVVILCGCMSYRFQGNVTQTSGNMPVTERKYRVEKIINKGNDGASLCSKNRLKESELCSDIMNRNPNIFSSASTSIPLEVEIYSCSESRDGRWSAIPSLLTLFILPVLQRTESQYELIVTSLADRNIRTSCIICFREDMKESQLSPIGLVSYDTVPYATSCKTGSCLVSESTTAEASLNLRTVCIETLAVAIGRCVGELEKQSPTVARTPASEPVKVAASSVDPTSLKEKIQQLKELKDAGVLTDQEYNAKRNQLIDQL